MEPCPICGKPSEVKRGEGDFGTFNCPTDGTFRLSGSGGAQLAGVEAKCETDEVFRAIAAKSLRIARRSAPQGHVPIITADAVESAWNIEF